MVSPIPLFCLRKDGVLLPLAIQLFEKPLEADMVGCFHIFSKILSNFSRKKTDST